MQRNDGAQTHDQTAHERVCMTVPEAATRLGISAEAVRARIHHGTLQRFAVTLDHPALRGIDASLEELRKKI
jgi:hypothetical protein